MATAAADELIAQGIAAATAAPAPQPEGARNACTWCGATENLKRCGGCRQAWFCDNDKKCLKEAWTKGGHKQQCKAAQRSAKEAKERDSGSSGGPRALPAAMKTTPKWVQRGPDSGGEEGEYRGPQMSDSFDAQPLDEEDECAICMGEPMSRSGVGVCSLECTHRYHRDCVQALRSWKVASPCTACDPEPPPPAWDDALRRYVRVRPLSAAARPPPAPIIVALR